MSARRAARKPPAPPDELAPALEAALLRHLEDAEAFGDFVGELFRTRRKQIGATLSRMGLTPPGDLDLTQRPESLSPTQLLDLFREIATG